MATRWLRELFSPLSYTVQARNLFKSLAIFLYRCCGYTNPTEIIAGAGSFFSTEASGSAGAFTGLAKSAGTISTIASANHVNGEKMRLDDGWNPSTQFTFSSAPSADTDIDITGAVSADEMRDRIIAAINGISTLEIEASSGGAAQVDLNHYRYGTRGNTTSTDDVADVGFVLTNMTGGLDGWVLTDSVYGAFSAADLGKVVCVVDPTNPANNGVYRIRRFISGDGVELDFRADIDNGEAFTAATGLTWYLWADDYDIPGTVNDLWRLDSPHATGWSIEFKMSILNTQWKVSVAVDGNWGGSRILGAGAAAKQLHMYSGNVPDGCFLCADVDTDGAYLNIWAMEVRGEGDKAQGVIGVSVCEVEPIEPDRSANERIALFGSITGSTATSPSVLRGGTNVFGNGQIIDESTGVPVARNMFMMDPSFDYANEGFTFWSGREMNSRLAARTATELKPWDVAKNDVWDGSLIIQDPDNNDQIGAYEIIGWATGHLVSRRLEIYGQSTGEQNNSPKNNIQCGQGGDRNRIHVYGAFIFSWPAGITFMMNN